MKLSQKNKKAAKLAVTIYRENGVAYSLSVTSTLQAKLPKTEIEKRYLELTGEAVSSNFLFTIESIKSKYLTEEMAIKIAFSKGVLKHLESLMHADIPITEIETSEEILFSAQDESDIIDAFLAKSELLQALYKTEFIGLNI